MNNILLNKQWITGKIKKKIKNTNEYDNRSKFTGYSKISVETTVYIN